MRHRPLKEINYLEIVTKVTGIFLEVGNLAVFLRADNYIETRYPFETTDGDNRRPLYNCYIPVDREFNLPTAEKSLDLLRESVIYENEQFYKISCMYDDGMRSSYFFVTGALKMRIPHKIRFHFK